MKFVALALALLLAVGSQAASLQADAPSQLEHVRAAMDVYLTQVKDSAIKALDQLDGTEYAQLKDTISQRLEDAYTQIKALQSSVSPVTDNVFSTISGATAELRASIQADFDALKTDLEPKRAALKEVIDRHIEDYRQRLEPIMTEYTAKHTAEMDALRTKMEPVLEELRGKIATNVEETKAALMPIVESVRGKLSERLQSLKDMAVPYVEEYKEQMKQAYAQVGSTSPEQLAELRAKIQPLADDIKVKLQTIFETVAASITKQ